MVKTERGFSLIELMVAMVIMAILLGIVVPNYSEHATKTRRSDGKQLLMTMMQTQERFFANNLRYTLALGDLGYTVVDNAVESGQGFYSITAAACGDGIASCVLLTATAQGKQDGDGNLSLNSLGTTTGKW